MKRLKKVLCDVLKMKEGDIADELTPNDVETWDSINALILVSVLESTFNVRFTLVEVMSVKCIGDITKLLRQHNVELLEN